MTPPELLTHLQSLGCTMRIDGSILHVSPRHLLMPALRVEIGLHKLALIALLTAPVETAYGHYHSNVLGADFWVCETQSDVDALRAEGAIGYLESEIRVLQGMRERHPEGFAEKLVKIHEAKVLGWIVEGVEYADATVPVVPISDTADDTQGP